MWFAATEPSSLAEPAFWTFLGVCVATLGTVAVQWLKGRGEKSATTAEPPSPELGSSVMMQLGAVVERTRVHGDRLDDSDQRDDMQDRALHNHGDRIEALERWAHRTDPDWDGRR